MTRILHTALPTLCLMFGLSACGDQATAPNHAASAASPAVTAASPAAASAVAANPASAAGDQQSPQMAFTAFGTQEAWRAVVDGDTLSLEGSAVTEAKLSVTHYAYSKGVEFSGKAGDKAVTLNIHALECKDQNGQANEFTATLDYGDKTFKGCAVEGAVAHAPT